MARMFGFVGLLIVLGVGAYIYKQQIVATSAPGGAAANPQATIDVIGVQKDLLSIANAERSHFALDGKYVDISELISNGDLAMKAPNRGPYSYSSEVGDSGFRITATYSGPEANVPKTLWIDETMQITKE